MSYFKSPQLQPLDTLFIFLIALFGSQLGAIPMAFGWVGAESALLFFTVAVIQDGLFLILVALFLKGRGQTWTHIRMTPFQAAYLSQGVIGGLGLYLLMAFAILALQQLLPGGLPPQNVEAYMDPQAPLFDKALVVFVIVILAPLAEEILFRGYLLRSLEAFMRPSVAIFWSGLLFGLVHGDLYRLLPLALGGWILAYLAQRLNSLWPPIIAHATWNLIMVMAVYAF